MRPKGAIARVGKAYLKEHLHEESWKRISKWQLLRQEKLWSGSCNVQQCVLRYVQHDVHNTKVKGICEGGFYIAGQEEKIDGICGQRQKTNPILNIKGKCVASVVRKVLNICSP